MINDQECNIPADMYIWIPPRM